jgi:hypothetical protein
MTLTAYVHLAPRLRLSGAIPLRLVCAFMACTGITLSFICFRLVLTYGGVHAYGLALCLA